MFVVKSDLVYANDTNKMDNKLQLVLEEKAEKKYNTFTNSIVYEMDKESLLELQYEARSEGKILIKIKEIVVGMIIGGIVIAESGRSGEEWVADAYKWVKSGAAVLYASLQKVLYGVSSSGCVKTSANGVWVCPY